MTSRLMAQLLNRLSQTLRSTPQLSPQHPLPMTLNQLTLEWDVEPTAAVAVGR